MLLSKAWSVKTVYFQTKKKIILKVLQNWASVMTSHCLTKMTDRRHFAAIYFTT